MDIVYPNAPDYPLLEQLTSTEAQKYADYLGLGEKPEGPTLP